MPLESELQPVRRRLSLTPLIDVIFLLLLFFMLTSTFSRYSDLTLGTIASQGGGAGRDERRPVFISIGPASLRLNADEVALADLTARIKAAGDGNILVSIRDATDSQRLVDVLAQLRSLEGRRITVLE